MGIIILLNFLYQVLLIIITSIVTAYFSNRGQYKEKKLRDGRYLEEALNKVYSPLYNIIMTDAYTPKGYDGLSHEQITKIKGIIESFVTFCPIELEVMVNDLYDTSIRINEMARMNNYESSKVDDDKRLYDYVTKKFTEKRKELGII